MAVAPSVFAGLIDDATGFFTATKLKPRVGQDEIICDLAVHVRVRADQDPLLFVNFGELTFFMSDKDVTYTWFECERFSTFSTAKLIDIDNKIDFNQFILVNLEVKTKINIALIDKNDASQRVTHDTQKWLEKILIVPAQLSIGSLILETDFVVTNIPQREYFLNVVIEEYSINEFEHNDPFTVTVCQFGFGTC